MVQCVFVDHLAKSTHFVSIKIWNSRLAATFVKDVFSCVDVKDIHYRSRHLLRVAPIELKVDITYE